MAITQNDLDEINKAIALGATRVSYDGKTVEYRSLQELYAIRDSLQVALGLTPAGAGNTVLVAHNRGT